MFKPPPPPWEILPSPGKKSADAHVYKLLRTERSSTFPDLLLRQRKEGKSDFRETLTLQMLI